MELYQNRVGINITESRLQITELVYSDDTFVIENMDEAYFENFIDFEAKETKLSSLLQNAFDEITIKKPLQSKVASVTLPGNMFNIIQIPFENTLRDTDIKENLRWEYSVLFPHILTDDFSIQYIPVQCNLPALNDTIITAGILKKYVKFFTGFCEQNKLKLVHIDNAHFASDNLIILDQLELKNELACSIYIDSGYVSVSFIRNSKPVYYKLIPLETTAAIVDKLRSIINSDIIAGDKFSSFYISGNITDSLVENIRNNLGITFKKLNITDKFRIKSSLSDEKFLSGMIKSFSASLGIACRAN